MFLSDLTISRRIFCRAFVLVPGGIMTSSSEEFHIYHCLPGAAIALHNAIKQSRFIQEQFFAVLMGN